MNLSDISRKTRGRTIFWLVAIILALFLWNHFKENKTYRWSEVLQTTDGKTLHIKRRVELVGGRDDITVFRGRRADKHVVVFKSINGTDIDVTWESTRRGFRNANPEVPLIVDYDSKENCYPFAFGFMTAFVEDKAQSIKQSLTNLK